MSSSPAGVTKFFLTSLLFLHFPSTCGTKFMLNTHMYSEKQNFAINLDRSCRLESYRINFFRACDTFWEMQSGFALKKIFIVFYWEPCRILCCWIRLQLQVTPYHHQSLWNFSSCAIAHNLWAPELQMGCTYNIFLPALKRGSTY